MNARTLLVTGATGFIGQHLCRSLLADGQELIVLTRNRNKALASFGANVTIVTTLNEIDHNTTIDGVINLAGAPILGFPWTKKRRELLVKSRVDTTRNLVTLFKHLAKPPEVLVSASAIGFYGVHQDEEIDESGNAQPIFQSELCAQWEREALQAEAMGIRTVRVRIGLVLGADGGALPQLARPVKFGVGAVLGRGDQYMSWIHVEDLVRLLQFALADPAVSGALNGVAPEPVKHSQFQKTLARQLNRWMVFKIPGWIVRTALGEMSQLLLEGQRVIPRRAKDMGFVWTYPKLDSALSHLLGG